MKTAMIEATVQENRPGRRDSVTSAIPPHADFEVDELQGKYTFVRLIGRGSYGNVAEARCNRTGSKVAIKHVSLGNLIDAKRILREILILRRLHHENLVSLIDLIAAGNSASFDSIYIVLEFVDTDLSKLIHSDQFFTELHVRYILYQILIGALALHTAGVCHRDLKPANVLVNEDVSVKICDFGLSRVMTAPPRLLRTQSANLDALPSLNRQLTNHVVTRWYRAPELILLHGSYSTSIDMWSIGCIFAELLSMMKENVATVAGRAPLFPGGSCFPMSAENPMAYADRFDQLNVIFDVIGTPSMGDIFATTGEKARTYLSALTKKAPKDLSAVYPGSSREAIHLLQLFLQFNPQKRITIEEALAHPFLSAVRDPLLEAFISTKVEKLPAEFENIPLDQNMICELIRGEIRHFQPHFGQAAKRGVVDFEPGSSSVIKKARNGLSTTERENYPMDASPFATRLQLYDSPMLSPRI